MTESPNRAFALFNAILSAAALAFLTWLLVVHDGTSGGLAERVTFLPPLNATLNATAAVLLTVGWIAIRRGKRELHKYLMVGAFAASALFLVSYVIYHYAHGDTPYTGVGAVRWVYFAVLISHVLLSVAVVPMVLSALWFAYRRRFATHRRITRVLVPIWLYVSVTGVAIFVMLQLAP